MIEFKMPTLAAEIEAATLVEWFKQPGDHIKRGDVIALAETQTGAIEIEAFDEGVIGEQRVQPGRQIEVGTVLATIFSSEEADRPLRAAKASGAVARHPYERRRSARPSTVRPRPAERTSAGCQQGGMLTIDGFSSAWPLANGAGDPAELAFDHAREPRMSKRGGAAREDLRKANGAAMLRSHREIPHYWVSHAIDATPLLEWVEAENAGRRAKNRLVYLAPLMKAAALALKDVPDLNGHYGERGFRPSSAVHMGLATPLRGGGLVAPAIRDTAARSVDELMFAIAALAPRARLGRLRRSEIADATIVLNNLVAGNVDGIFPLIHPPQVAIIACGAAGPRPWAIADTVCVRQVIQVTVAGDHRVSHALRAAEFLSRLSELLSKPEAL
ncbi:2-oxo acid dehydrogenase subunit E2 [Sinorhizobium alkalisoli]|uniref:Dihydrolipoamide acetyltransferase component of pyruvate dehydrogenase complex n=1 Tax=Sinorhizobium alkalisoli TaxID=1752398 RepID=A0A1E3V7R4_9HYPH|nr:2-oxo acid dehydrogenase subunit E2 [Sinorhizobium alkalisoli]MCG5480695.1 2-oxo acid dehydrogenase subunit E2 [Sinorhizobium alkalisoli]ODR89515.1 dihydrolipoyllysine acetyltransferase [Sinorhizobium alkalisoli]